MHIKVKENATPYRVTTPRHIPIPQFEAVKAELRRMENLGVIQKIEEPTEWCHPIVVVTKPNGKIWICIDLTKLNSNVETELYQLESVDETLARIGEEGVIMSKLDAKFGYWQLKLHKDSQLLTTFITLIG